MMNNSQAEEFQCVNTMRKLKRYANLGLEQMVKPVSSFSAGVVEDEVVKVASVKVGAVSVDLEETEGGDTFSINSNIGLVATRNAIHGVNQDLRTNARGICKACIGENQNACGSVGFGEKQGIDGAKAELESEPKFESISEADSASASATNSAINSAVNFGTKFAKSSVLRNGDQEDGTRAPRDVNSRVNLGIPPNRALMLARYYEELVPGIDLVSFWLRLQEISEESLDKKLLWSAKPSFEISETKRLVASIWSRAPEVMELISDYAFLKSLAVDSEIFGAKGYLAGEASLLRAKGAKAILAFRGLNEKATELLGIYGEYALNSTFDVKAQVKTIQGKVNSAYFKRVLPRLMELNDIPVARLSLITKKLAILCDFGVPFYRLEWLNDQGVSELAVMLKAMTTVLIDADDKIIGVKGTYGAQALDLNQNSVCIYDEVFNLDLTLNEELLTQKGLRALSWHEDAPLILRHLVLKYASHLLLEQSFMLGVGELYLVPSKNTRFAKGKGIGMTLGASQSTNICGWESVTSLKSPLFKAYNPTAAILRSDYMNFISERTIRELVTSISKVTGLNLGVSNLVCSKYFGELMLYKGFEKKDVASIENVIRRQLVRHFEGKVSFSKGTRIFGQGEYYYMQIMMALVLVNVIAPFLVARLNNQCHFAKLSTHNNKVLQEFVNEFCYKGDCKDYWSQAKKSSAVRFLDICVSEECHEREDHEQNGHELKSPGLKLGLGSHSQELEGYLVYTPKGGNPTAFGAALKALLRSVTPSEDEPDSMDEHDRTNPQKELQDPLLRRALKSVCRFYGFKEYQVLDCLSYETFEKVVRIYGEDLAAGGLSYVVRTDNKQAFLVPTKCISRLEYLELAKAPIYPRRLRSTEQVQVFKTEVKAFLGRFWAEADLEALF